MLSYHAETASTAKRQGAINVGNVAWQCDGVKCVGIGPWATPPRACASPGARGRPFRVFAQFAPRDVAVCNEARARGAREIRAAGKGAAQGGARQRAGVRLKSV
jgi:hypothetical protein